MCQCLVSSPPDAAVVLEGAGSLLTFQAQLNGTWVVFLLKGKNNQVVKARMTLYKSYIWALEVHKITIIIINNHIMFYL